MAKRTRLPPKLLLTTHKYGESHAEKAPTTSLNFSLPLQLNKQNTHTQNRKEKKKKGNRPRAAGYMDAHFRN